MDDATEAPPISSYGLRVAGFLITVAGVLLAGVGSIREWVEVGGVAGSNQANIPPSQWLGTELWQGKVVLALALVALLAVLVTRMGATARIRKAAAGILLVAALATTAIAGATLLLGTSRYIDEEVAKAAAANQDTLRSALEASFHLGVWLTLAGGVVMLVGSTLTLAWAMRPRPDWDEAETADESADA
jgi:hypothetical protein